MSNKHKKVCIVLNYNDHLLIVVSTITGYVSISAFDFLVAIPVGITGSAVGLRICAITARIKRFKSMIKKKKKKHDKIVLLAKSRLNSIKLLLPKVLVDSNIGHNEFVLINNVLKEFYDMKEEIKNFNNK